VTSAEKDEGIKENREIKLTIMTTRIENLN
jgi:hypothetical protein